MALSDIDPPRPEGTSPAWLPPVTLGLLLLALCGLVAHSLCFNFVTDDAFISFVYSRNLVQHGQLVFNLGERVEGYTNFLWTLLIALGLWLHVPAETSSRVLGTLCAGLTLVICTLALRRFRRRGDGPLHPYDAVPALVLCLVPGYACWSSGGLETQLFTMFVTAGAFLYLSASPAGVRWPSGLCFGLAALTRPEGLLFFGLTGLHLLMRKARRGPGALRPTGAEWRFVGVFLLLVVPHLLWRRAYYGYWVPNTFYVKSSGGSGAWEQGGYFLLLFAREQKLFLLPLLAVLGLWRDARDRLLLGYTLLLSAVFLIYVAAVGGDFMGLHRFLMPIVPLNGVVGLLGLHRLLLRLPRSAGTALVGLLLGLHGANSYFVDRHALGFIGADHGIDTPGYLRSYTADRAAIGRWLGSVVAPDDYQVVGGAGAQVYYAGIRALDSFGLSDEYVAHKVPAISSRPGHQKFAPLPYVLSRHPTLLTYNLYRIEDRPYVPPPAEAAQWRARGFHYVSVQVPGLSRPYYTFLKRIDRRLGPLPPADDLD